MPWLRSSANKAQTKVFCCCLIVNFSVALHRTCYIIVCIAPWCLAVYKTSTTSIQSIGFTVTGIPFCFSELLIISFSFDLELLKATKSAWDFLGVNFWSRDFLGFAGSLKEFFGCHENSDPESSDLRPQTPKTQTPRFL